MPRKKIIIAAVITSVLISSFAFCMHLFAQPKTLYWGSRGADVSTLQTRLRDWGYLKGPVDGVFGAQTAQAVRAFQRKNGLPVDGVVGPQTWRALGINVGAGAPAPAPTPAPADKRPAEYRPSRAVSNRDDITLLARAVHAEAGAEPYEGKVAVGAVILNRINSPDFPNTLSGVIYQPLAFESVSNGIINRPPSDESLRAAQDAMNGWDPTYGSLFFWNPSKPVNPWIWSRRIVVRIGEHVFGL